MKKKFLLISLFVLFSRETQAQGCGQLQWKCKDGECIPLEELCDGTQDCRDRSDERPEECLNIACPSFSFRCAYGACIDMLKECDGKKDCADNSDERSPKCPAPISEDFERNCLPEEMQCDSGKCVLLENACDGRVDCDDQSDETFRRCASIDCPPHTFRCSYGACIDGGGKCNGVVDCADGSDETTTLCGANHATKRPVANRGPDNGDFGILDGCRFDPPYNVIAHYASNSSDYVRPREVVADYDSIVYKCRRNYALTGSETNFCEDQKWKNPHPNCTKYCRNDIIKGITFQVSCERFGARVPCHGPPILPKTRVKVTCNVGYRKPYPFQEILVCGETGEWDYYPRRCEQVCGVEYTEAIPFIRGGEKINNTLVPWHVGIYSNRTTARYEQICGGTIISAKLVISAAHCFWNPQSNVINDKSYYAVAAGKYYRDYYAKEPLAPQLLAVEEIAIPNGYKDVSLSYVSDIAMIVVAGYFEFTAYIRPVCIEWLSYNQKSIRSKRIGIIAGWGKDATGKSSEVLKAVKLPTVSYEECNDQVEPKYKTHVTGDKFCVAKTPGDAVCQGDSGGGFSISRDVNGVKVYYLWGIVSVGLTEREDCSNDYITVFTNVQFYNEMVTHYEIRTRHN